MTLVKLHGKLGEAVGRDEWKLEVSSVKEAFHAINSQSEDAVRKFFVKKENLYSRYEVLINKESTTPSNDRFYNELTLDRKDIQSIDIVPVLEGASLGWIGVFMGGAGFLNANSQQSALASMALLFYGISSLLSDPPEMPEQKQIANPSTDPTALANSYLFNGPVNVINEGGPVPLGYGRLMVGSQVIMSSYDVRRVLVKEAGRIR
jgi:predicted phage tail protein